MPTERLGGAPFFRVDCHREVAGNGWDEPCKSRGLRTVLWAAGGEIPPADPAISRPGTAVSVGAALSGAPMEPTPAAVTNSGLGVPAPGTIFTQTETNFGFFVVGMFFCANIDRYFIR
jgi:hypothetical protein